MIDTKDSLQIHFDYRLDIPVLIARGLLEGSLVSDIDLDRYRDRFSRLTIKEYALSRYDIKEKEKALFYGDVVEFLNHAD